MSKLKVRKIGNSLGVILPKEIQETLNISEGDIIDATHLEGEGKVILGGFLSHHSKWNFPEVKMSDSDSEWINADLEDEADEAPEW